MKENYFLLLLILMTSCVTKNSLNEDANCNELIPVFSKEISNDSNNGQLYYRRAFCLSEMNQHLQAQADYFKAIKLGFKPDLCYFQLGVNYLEDEQDSLAHIYLQKSLAFDSGNELTLKMLRMSAQGMEVKRIKKKLSQTRK